MRSHILVSILAASSRLPTLPVERLAHSLEMSEWFGAAGLIVGAGVVFALRVAGLSWTWGLPWLLLSPLAWLISGRVGIGFGLCAVTVVVFGAYKHLRDLQVGGDLAQRARARIGPGVLLRARYGQRKLSTGRWVTHEGMVVGSARDGELVRVPLLGDRAVHALAPGATGSGKTVLLVLAALLAILRGFGVVFIDPKGDDFVAEQLSAAARRAGRPFYKWSPRGGYVYNPYQHGSDTEIVDKLLAPEPFSEPHYLRLAQRYLGQEVRALRAAGVALSLKVIVEYTQPGRLASLARKLPREHATQLLEYLESLTAQEERDLGGVRHRLAIPAESDAGRWLDPRTPAQQIELRAALAQGAVVLVRLEADRLPMLAPMVAGAVVQDLAAIADERQHGHQRPGLIVIDEFSAVAPRQVVRLFGRARGANLSLLLGTQELSEFEGAGIGAVLGGGGILDPVLGNVDVTFAFRQNVPRSAELIAEIAGTRGAWITTQQTRGHAGLLTGMGTRVRGREFIIHPDQIKRLHIGECAVIVPRLGIAKIVRVLHPSKLEGKRQQW